VIPCRWVAAPCYGPLFSLPVPGLVGQEDRSTSLRPCSECMKDNQDGADARRHAVAATNLPIQSLDGIGVSMVAGADDGKENEWCGRFGEQAARGLPLADDSQMLFNKGIHGLCSPNRQLTMSRLVSAIVETRTTEMEREAQLGLSVT
jgi:hypothetical protein